MHVGDSLGRSNGRIAARQSTSFKEQVTLTPSAPAKTNMRRLIPALTFAALVLTLHAIVTEPVAHSQSPVFGDPINVSSNPDESRAPAVAADGANVYVAWFDYRDPGLCNIMFKSSADKGKTFGSVLNVSNVPTSDPPFCARNHSVAAAGGKVYVVWHMNRRRLRQ